MGRAGCAHAALLLARLRFTRRVRVAPRHSSLPPPSRDSNICSPRRLGCPSCPSHARLCRATRTSVLPIASVALLALRALVCAGAPLEHLFSPSPPLPFLRFARSLVPARHSNTCSPRRPGCLSCLRTLACAARLEHLFSPSPWLPLLLLMRTRPLACLPAPRAPPAG